MPVTARLSKKPKHQISSYCSGGDGATATSSHNPTTGRHKGSLVGQIDKNLLCTFALLDSQIAELFLSTTSTSTLVEK